MTSPWYLPSALLAVVLLLSPAVPAAAAPAPGAEADVEEQVEDYLDAMVASGVPAVAVVLTRGEDVLASVGRGGGGEGDGGEVDARTPFRVDSLSKAFTATAVLQLVERGAVDLETPVRSYLPELRTGDPRSDDITVRQLLNQSTGLTDPTLGFDQYAADVRTPEQAVELLRRSRLAYPPGTSWDYCNVNYWIAARLVEVVTGQEFSAYLEQQVLQPLRMHDTEQHGVPGRAVVATPTHSYAFGRAVHLGDPDYFAGGSGGVVTTAEDMGRWLRFQHGAAPTHATVLGADMVREMHRRQSPLEHYPVGYALGWWSGEPADGGVSRVSHSGTGPGSAAYAGLFPGRVGVAVLVGASGPRPDQVGQDMYELVTDGRITETVALPSPWRDLSLTLAMLVGALASVRGATRARRWAARGRRRVRALLLAPLLLPALLIGFAPFLGGHLLGRQASWTVLWYVAPVPTAALALTAACLLLLTGARAVVLAAPEPG